MTDDLCLATETDVPISLLSSARPRVEVGATLTGADVKADAEAHKDGCVEMSSVLSGGWMADWLSSVGPPTQTLRLGRHDP
jgi:hypothetical protein